MTMVKVSYDSGGGVFGEGACDQHLAELVY